MITPRFLRRPAGLLLLAAPAVVGLAASAPVVVPRFTHPGAGQTFYFVLTDRFANGDPANDTGGFPGGTEEHGFDPTRIGYFHGGDFAGLISKLDYLKNLGVTAVWVTPPFQNKPVQQGSAAYHGYWVTDFLKIDPHLGTNDDFRAFVQAAHARGLKVYMDIIANHTADVIHYPDNRTDYRDTQAHPLRDATGAPVRERDFAYNGLGDPARPALSAETGFPYRPLVAEAEKTVKNPAWLNDVTLYHNRGNSAFRDESSVFGDFSGLDDTFTEHPRVVQGMIEIFSSWVRDYGVDGFRIDTARHVNAEFWQAFAPAIRAVARAAGRPDFIQFGEVANETLDVPYLSEFSTHMPLDTTLDFGFFVAARNFVSRGGTAAALTDLFQRDDLYTDHDSNIHTTTTFLGNHDAGRFAHFLQQDNPGASPVLLADLAKLGHGLLLLSRGQPVIYYGDEQGMIGRGGWDMQAREDMFPSRAPDFRDAPLLATTRTGADDKFDPQHPFYVLISRLAALRAAHPALRTGALLPRATASQDVFAFSRFDRRERVEYLAAFNNSRTQSLTVAVPTSQLPGAKLARLFASHDDASDEITADGEGRAVVTIPPLQFAVWRAVAPLGPPEAARISLVTPATGAVLQLGQRALDGVVFPLRAEFRAEVAGGDGLGEVTFTLERASRPGQIEYLGTDDAAPYRIFWRPPNDLRPGERFALTATHNDLRGHIVSAQSADLTLGSTEVPAGIVGSKTPVITRHPAATGTTPGDTVTLTVAAEGTGPLEYQWLRNGEEVSGATDATLTFKATRATAGTYRALVRNRAGTTLSAEAAVTLPGLAARLEKHPEFSSQFVAPRNVDVWLPPGYDADPSARWPVVYMHDGQNLFDPATSYGGVPWSADKGVERLLATGLGPGAILVAIWNTPARFAEYLPQKAVSADLYEGFVQQFKLPPAPPQGDAYLKFLVEELKPFMDRSYRTRPEPEHTSIMGASMGALISLYAVCEYPEVFGGAGCVSTHWPLGDGVVTAWFAKNLPKPGRNRFYFDFGTKTLDAGYEPYQRRVDAVMRAAGYREGVDWMTRKYMGAEHSERSWRDRVDIPLHFLLKP
ncbi:MAG: alpha-amylase family glycosyl hydrolase [Verrucomicrobiota bacterium]